MSELWFRHNKTYATAPETAPMKIRTTHVYPPIPIREFDWSAVDEDTYDADCDQDGFFSKSPVGWGATEAEAIADLKEQLEQK